MNAPHTSSVVDPAIYAGYLPGLHRDEVQWHTLHFSAHGQSLSVKVPQLSLVQLDAVAARVRQASREQLKAMPVSHIIDVVHRVVLRLLDANDPCRQLADRVLPVVTGFDAEMVRLSLNAYLKTFRQLQLHRFVAEDLANPKLLDEFQPRPKGGWAKALGPDVLVHVWAGNVPALSLWSLVSGLLVKAGSVGKVATAEPVFAGWFAQLLAEEEPALADCLAVVWWPGSSTTPTDTHADTQAEIQAQMQAEMQAEVQARHLFAHAEVVLAYGGNAALQHMQAWVPVTTRFLAHGHKLSFGMVDASALNRRQARFTAQQAALDVTRFDQHGCYSPHVFYVARGGAVSPREWAQLLAGELAALQHKMPRRALSLEEGTTLAHWLQDQALRSLQGQVVELLGQDNDAWRVVYADTPMPLQAGALYRTVQVVALDSLQEVVALIAPQRDYLQTVGLAAAPEVLLAWAEVLGLAGVTRVCALGAMASPEAGWHHDGRFSLLDLVRMVELEASAEQAAQAFAPYRD